MVIALPSGVRYVTRLCGDGLPVRLILIVRSISFGSNHLLGPKIARRSLPFFFRSIHTDVRKKGAESVASMWKTVEIQLEVDFSESTMRNDRSRQLSII